MRRIVLLSLVALIAALPVPAASVDLESTPYIQRVFSDGERIEYALSWLGIVGGTATMTVTPSADSIRILSLAKSKGAIGRLYPVRDEIVSIVSRSNFSTLRYHKKLDERGRSKSELTVFDPKRGVARLEGEEIPYKPPIFDPLSSIYYIRTLDLDPGDVAYVTMMADGEIYELQIDAIRRETVEIEGSTFKTIMVEPKMRHGGIFRDENNRLLIWLTDDERRIPVRIRSELEFGSITASIRSARLGATATARRGTPRE